MPILINKPVLTLNQFTLNTPSGKIDLHGFVTTQGFEKNDINDQNKFMQHMLLDLTMSVPKSVLSYIFILQMKYLLSAGNASMDAQSSRALTKVVNIILDSRVNEWVKKGYLFDNKNILSTRLVMESGNLFLNGKLSK